ncbi:MAG: hypothetical protein NTU41_00735 [Chloroflexi bacterium]|nr:hypothetical protein [Chloroflexota bacterium]
MSYTAIEVKNLGKRCRLGQQVGYKTLRESLTNAITSPFHRLRYEPSATSHELGRHQL